MDERMFKIVKCTKCDKRIMKEHHTNPDLYVKMNNTPAQLPGGRCPECGAEYDISKEDGVEIFLAKRGEIYPDGGSFPASQKRVTMAEVIGLSHEVEEDSAPKEFTPIPQAAPDMAGITDALNAAKEEVKPKPKAKPKAKAKPKPKPKTKVKAK
jgi:hypothetical protein